VIQPAFHGSLADARGQGVRRVLDDWDMRPRVIFATSPRGRGVRDRDHDDALVFFVSADSSFEGSRFFVEGSTSTKTGLARGTGSSRGAYEVYGEVTTRRRTDSRRDERQVERRGAGGEGDGVELRVGCAGGGRWRGGPFGATYFVTAASSSRAFGPW